MKQMDNLLFQQSQTIDEIKNRLNCIESGALNSLNGTGTGTSNQVVEHIKPCLMSDPEFVGGIVDNIMTNSNLSEIIEQIETVQTENRELRELLYAQQKTINEINIMLLKLMSQGLKGNNDKGKGKIKSKGQQDQEDQDQEDQDQEDQDQEDQDQEDQDQEDQDQEDQAQGQDQGQEDQDQDQDQGQDQGQGQEDQDQGQDQGQDQDQIPNVALEIEDK
jgi:hypothetical protein